MKKQFCLTTQATLIHEYLSNTDPVDIRRKLNVHKTLNRRPGRLLNVLCTFNLRLVSTWEADFKKALLIKKACTSSLAKFYVFPFLITMVFFKINTSVEVLPELSKKFHTERFYCMIAASQNRKHFRLIFELKHLVNKD